MRAEFWRLQARHELAGRRREFRRLHLAGLKAYVDGAVRLGADPSNEMVRDARREILEMERADR